jgi:hypothetical protein
MISQGPLTLTQQSTEKVHEIPAAQCSDYQEDDDVALS